MFLVAACGGDEEPVADTGATDAVSDPATDLGGTDGSTPDADVAPVDAVEDSVADARSDALEPDADAGVPCVDPAPDCVECALDFTGADIDRPSTRVAVIANGAGVLRVQNVRMQDTPPAVQLSNSWYDYIDRVASDWVPNETLTGFDSVGSLIPIESGQRFEVQVAFNEIMDGPTGCSAGACGTAILDYELCDGTIVSETITVTRR
jgi:hypothetical protein